MFWSSDAFWSRLESDDAFIVLPSTTPKRATCPRHPEFDKQNGSHLANC